jgi:hypothetical protein
VQVSRSGLRTLSVPLAIEHPVIKKYMLKKDELPVKMLLYLVLFYENNCNIPGLELIK